MSSFENKDVCSTNNKKKSETLTKVRRLDCRKKTALLLYPTDLLCSIKVSLLDR